VTKVKSKRPNFEVKLAIALLKNRKEVDLNLPVSGQLDDPSQPWKVTLR
jgi:hypothetical protein